MLASLAYCVCHIVHLCMPCASAVRRSSACHAKEHAASCHSCSISTMVAGDYNAARIIATEYIGGKEVSAGDRGGCSWLASAGSQHILAASSALFVDMHVCC